MIRIRSTEVQIPQGVIVMDCLVLMYNGDIVTGPAMSPEGLEPSDTVWSLSHIGINTSLL